jgi:hypothetical protein
MLIPTDVPLAVVVVLVAVNFTLCTYLEIRFRRKIRLGLIKEHRYTPRQLEEFRRIRDKMGAKSERE